MPQIEESSVSQISKSSDIDYQSPSFKKPSSQIKTPHKMDSGETVQSVFFRKFKRINTEGGKELTKQIANLDNSTRQLLKIQMASYNMNASKLFEIRQILSAFERNT